MGYLEGGHDGHTMSEQKEGEEKRSPRIEDAKKEMELCITGSGIVGGGRDRGSDRLMWTLLLVSPVAVGCPVGTWNLFLPAFRSFPLRSLLSDYRASPLSFMLFYALLR